MGAIPGLWRTSLFLVTGLLVSGVAIAQVGGGAHGSAPAQRTRDGSVGVWNLGLATDHNFRVDGGVVAFLVPERDQGGTDLNGDGDAGATHNPQDPNDIGDTVLHVWRAADRSVVNVGLDALRFEQQDGLLVFSVIEPRQGYTDLNGDGDLFDPIIHVFDSDTGETLNLMAGGAGDAKMEGRKAVFRLSEPRDSVDLNGDGDQDDYVFHVFDADTGVISNLGVCSTNYFALNGNLLVHTPFEWLEGLDLNGDGDSDDIVTQVYNLSTNTSVNTGLAGGQFATDGELVAISVYEAGQGDIDLNGDGDRLDFVVHVFDPSTSAITSVGRSTILGGPQFENGLVTMFTRESQEGGTDLNSDGDTLDWVLTLYDAQSNQLIDSGLAVIPAPGDTNLTERYFTFFIREFQHGGADLNGDGDISDAVVHVFDVQSGTFSNLGLVGGLGGGDALHGDILALDVGEQSQGNTDLNGDGDTSDRILHVLNLASGDVTNLGLDKFSAPLHVHNNLVVFVVSEANQAATDLNGDGDTLDAVLHVYEADTGVLTNLGLASTNSYRVDDGLIVFMVREHNHGNTDLNGDGDSDDLVLHVVDARMAAVPGMLDALIGEVLALEIPSGTRRALLARLRAAAVVLSDSNPANDVAGIVRLNSFIGSVTALSGDPLNRAEAAALIAVAMDLIARLGG